ncbi:unnamed protein product [Didymodactylos carnosus]|uniref:Uncharacterized protein n=1 Tax=Didymodactylos carnosus TaxID=1234261 RepID=A0A8S2G400_9BILA|nr:unnamed protein product [Didymodactylos carnosus]CAF4440145.1 unnamed protein product [Didymodactylos carnosus]
MASDEAQKLEPLRLELQLQAHQLNWPLHVGPPLSNQGAFGRVFDGLWTSTQEAVVIKYQRHSRTNRYVTMLDIQSLKSQSEQACTHTPYMMLYFDQGGLPEYRLYPLQKSIVPVEYYVGVKATLCQTLPAAQAKAYFGKIRNKKIIIALLIE